MATEQSTTTGVQQGSGPEWASWVAALFGLWILLSPFVLSGNIATGNPMISNVVSGIIVLVLTVYTAYMIRTT